ncbi:MAG: DUF922 domain-containing protein [Asticcacaulis sp.]|nr:DUF922 domain-containing protein [Asticcacaulis sp.]
MAGIVLALLTTPPRPTTPIPAMADVAADDSVLRAFPNTVVTYYDVPGADTASVVAFLQAHGPIDSHDQWRGDARTDWHIDWRWPPGQNGCDTAHVQVTFSGKVLLPRLTDARRMRPDVARAWQHYFDALVVHESGHLRHAYQHMNEVADAVRRQNCAGANAAGMSVIRTLADYDAVYDRETVHGRSQGAVYPGI